MAGIKICLGERPPVEPDEDEDGCPLTPDGWSSVRSAPGCNWLGEKEALLMVARIETQTKSGASALIALYKARQILEKAIADAESELDSEHVEMGWSKWRPIPGDDGDFY